MDNISCAFGMNLPFAIGDLVYIVWNEISDPKRKTITLSKIRKIQLTQYGLSFVIEDNELVFHANAIGKTVFSSFNDAVGAIMAGMKDEHVGDTVIVLATADFDSSGKSRLAIEKVCGTCRYRDYDYEYDNYPWVMEEWMCLNGSSKKSLHNIGLRETCENWESILAETVDKSYD